MTAPETRAVIAALTAEGAEARFVGGCVRDAVLGRPVKDIDIATHDAPEVVMALLERAGIQAIPTGLKHGTVTAVIAKAHFEITTLRRDVETDGRRARVAFTGDWAEDAARRDFTMNALFLSPEGALFDPFGGLEDLRKGRVRFVGDARRRIREDVLRLLRFFRFFAHYDRPPPDEAALAACRELAPELPKLSGERVSAEILGLLDAPDPVATFKLMREEGILAHVLPEARAFERLYAATQLERAEDVPGLTPDALRRLAAVLEVDAPGAEAVAARLRLSNVRKERLVAMAAPPEAVGPGADLRAVRGALYRLGPDLFRDLALIEWARMKAADRDLPAAVTQGFRKQLEAADKWRPLALPVRGKDAVALGVAPGPEVGGLLVQVEAWWIAGDFRAGRKECLEKLRSLAAESQDRRTKKQRS